ncbi:hypothetical protein [Falsibacillus albus]|uniref:Uncharacterized protein n=1 Tax=Falsibacillus albus TaxID=2478915 RepID=A0A3L7JQI5_9BACI|nr:hypothetical protein [Falsibacillus albus]RLQ92329.1 hypothetical protein D9X91_19855 [Falsibacillus albus]
MKQNSIFLMLLPVPFFFHYYEYWNHANGHEARFLMLGFLLVTATAGIVARRLNLGKLLVLNTITAIISLVLGHLFIPNDMAWFTPFGRDAAIIFIGAIYCFGQLVIKGAGRILFRQKSSV